MTDIIDSVQLQEIDDEFVELFDITLPGYDVGDANGNYYLFNGFDGETTQVQFKSKTYTAIPIQLTGIEISASGAHSRPSLTVANIPALAGSVQNDTTEPGDVGTLDEIRNDSTAGVLEFDTNDDLIGTKVIYRKTFKSKLGTSGTEEFPPQTFYIDRITSENNIFVTFELASPMDIEGAKIPARMVIGRYCPWQYQGVEQGFGGGCTWPTDATQTRFFDYEDNEIDISSLSYSSSTSYDRGEKALTTSPQHQVWEALFDGTVGKDPRYFRKYWKRIDLCGKTLNSCKIRFQYNGSSLDQDRPLPFGGFPGSKKYR